MKTLTLQQGSPEWAAHRARSLNASELSAAMGLSSYITRSALVKQKATGIAPEIDAATQHRFNKGHEFEAIARPWAEEIIGEELFPVVLAGEVDALPLSASLDGQTLTGDVTWEHKSGNATLLARLDAGVIPDEYHPQMEQGLLLSGATRCLFMASSGDREAMRYAWYESNPELRAKIVPTWRQFQADVAAYVPTDPVAPAMAAPIESLPAVVVQVQGALTVGGNLDAFGLALRDFIARIPARPATDQQFADAEAACKALKRAEDALAQAEDGALAQISDVELMRRTVADLKDLARSTRLATEKLVKAEKDARRTEKVMAARRAFDKHVAACQLDIKGVRLNVPMPDFGAAIKGLSSLASIDDKLTAALIASQAEVNTLASRIINNLQTLDSVPQYAHLFADRQDLAYKDAETLELLMQKRVDAEAARIEAERQRIRDEEERKAREAAERAAEAERARIRAEEQHKARMEAAERAKAEQAEAAEREAAARREQILAEAAKPAVTRALEMIEREKDVTPGKPIAPAPIDAAPVAAGIANAAATGDAADEAPTLTLGAINERLHPISISAAGLAEFGIEPLLERVAGRIDRHVERLLTAQRADLTRRAQAEPAHPTAGIWVPTELAERVQETMGEFLMDHGWRQQDMDTSDEFGALLAAAPRQSSPMAEKQYPPLPAPDTHCFDEDTGKDVWSYSESLMRAYVDADRAMRAAPAPAAQGDALPREDFAWMVVQEACETEPADEDDPECIRILRRDLKSAVLAAFLREDAARGAQGESDEPV